MYGIEELIALAAEKRASDVHLIAGLPPKCRIDGRIRSRPSDSWILVLRLRDGVSE